MSILPETISFRDFGAIGDGVADDTAALQATINDGRPIVFGNGVYKTKALTLRAGTSIRGHGPNCIIAEDSTDLYTGPLLTADSSSATSFLDGIRLANFKVLGASASGFSEFRALASLNGVRDCRVESVEIRHGTTNRGERCPVSVLKRDQVLEIRRRRAAGEMRKHIAEAFGISPATVNNVCDGTSWAWL